VLSSW